MMLLKKTYFTKLQSTIWEKNVNKDDMNLTDIDEDMLQRLITKDVESIDNPKYKL